MSVFGSLGDLSTEGLHAALDRFNLGRLLTAQAVTAGLFGKNVGLTTDRGKWVLRGAASTDEPFRRQRFWAARVRNACGLPVPWPFHIEPDDSLFGWPYQLTPWMPGTYEHNAVGAVALGRAAAELRKVTFDTFGAWSDRLNGIEPFMGTAREWLIARTQVWVERCARSSEPLVESDLAFLEETFPDELDVVPTYVHHDLTTGNTVCVNGDVSGLFDLGEGLIGDPFEDLARSTWDLSRTAPELAALFLRSYEEAARVLVPLERLRKYVVLDLIVIWEYTQRAARRRVEARTFEGWTETLTSRVDVARTRRRRSGRLEPAERWGFTTRATTGGAKMCCAGRRCPQ